MSSLPCDRTRSETRSTSRFSRRIYRQHAFSATPQAWNQGSAHRDPPPYSNLTPRDGRLSGTKRGQPLGASTTWDPARTTASLRHRPRHLVSYAPRNPRGVLVECYALVGQVHGVPTDVEEKDFVTSCQGGAEIPVKDSPTGFALVLEDARMTGQALFYLLLPMSQPRLPV
eukprot:749319-Hanusia_phi.AAC.1